MIGGDPILGKILSEIALATIAVTILGSALVAFLCVQAFRRLFGLDVFDPWMEVTQN